MPAISIIWTVLYGIATLTFFSVAAVIMVVGIQDLRSLLSKSNRKDRGGRDDSNNEMKGV